MLGGMLAGHDESAGEKEEEIYQDGFFWSNGQYKPIYKKREFKTFYGMSSDTAQKKYYGGQKEYRASEGRTVRVPYRGSVENTIQEILGGLRSTCTYVGAPGLKQLSKCTTFIRVNNTHNRVFIDKEI
jgi:GMP reductase